MYQGRDKLDPRGFGQTKNQPRLARSLPPSLPFMQPCLCYRTFSHSRQFLYRTRNASLLCSTRPRILSLPVRFRFHIFSCPM